MRRKPYPENVLAQADARADRAEQFYESLLGNFGVPNVTRQQIVASIRSSLVVSFLAGWDAAIGALDANDES